MRISTTPISTPGSTAADKQGGSPSLLQTLAQADSLVTGSEAAMQIAGSRRTVSDVSQQSGQSPCSLDAQKPASSLKSSSGNMSCQCFTSAMSLLETLAIEDVKPTLSSVAHLLHMKKRALMQCNTLLDCQRCSSVSSFMVLLIVLCQKLLASYERVLVILTEQYNRLSERRRADELESPPNAGNTDSDEERQMMVKDYDLDPAEEPCIFAGLASMQLRGLASFLARMRHVMRSWNWDPHVTMVDSVERRVREQLRLFDKDAHGR